MLFRGSSLDVAPRMTHIHVFFLLFLFVCLMIFDIFPLCQRIGEVPIFGCRHQQHCRAKVNTKFKNNNNNNNYKKKKKWASCSRAGCGPELRQATRSSRRKFSSSMQVTGQDQAAQDLFFSFESIRPLSIAYTPNSSKLTKTGRMRLTLTNSIDILRCSGLMGRQSLLIMDEDGSGEIDFREFVIATWNYCSLD